MPAALILTLDAALDGCSAGVVRGDRVVAELRQPGGRGSSAALPEMARLVLRQAGVTAAELDCIAVTVGPGSFTGVRAALSLAAGIGLAAGVKVVGVDVATAIRAETPDGGRPVWVAIDSKRGRVFLDTGGGVRSLAPDELPSPDGTVDIAGDAAVAVAARLGESGFSARALPGTGLGPLGIARGAVSAGLPAVPLYVDAVAARPNGAVRPEPE